MDRLITSHQFGFRQEGEGIRSKLEKRKIWLCKQQSCLKWFTTDLNIKPYLEDNFERNNKIWVTSKIRKHLS